MNSIYMKEINGLNYIREIKNEDGNITGYLMFNNKNRPIREVYRYINRCIKRDGKELNTIKRICYDLKYFYDFILINKLDIEFITYEEFYCFIRDYLIIIDPKYRKRDCIEWSMMKRVHVLSIHGEESTIILDENKINGLAPSSIKRIADSVKNYLIYLKEIENIDISVEDIFNEVVIKGDNDNDILSHIHKKSKKVLSVNKILRAAKVMVKNRNYIEPVDYGQVFEREEMESFFYQINKQKNIMYTLFFYLLKVTGARIGEVRALKIFNVEYNGLKVDYEKINADIKLISKETNLWRIYIKIRENNPSDLQIKGNVERNIDVIDKERILEDLLTKSLLYRRLLLKRKKKESSFLFINRNGDRFLGARTEQVFKETLIKANLQERYGRGGLVPHSFRHTYASSFIKSFDNEDSERGLRLLSKQLGHKSIETTRKTYIHFFKSEYVNILEMMEENSKL